MYIRDCLDYIAEEEGGNKMFAILIFIAQFLLPILAIVGFVLIAITPAFRKDFLLIGLSAGAFVLGIICLILNKKLLER